MLRVLSSRESSSDGRPVLLRTHTLALNAMPTQEVLIAKLAPNDPQADRILDMYEAETGNAPNLDLGNKRTYYIEAKSMHAAERQVADDLRRVGGNTWPDHVAIARGDDV
jgi:hypothetical protein